MWSLWCLSYHWWCTNSSWWSLTGKAAYGLCQDQKYHWGTQGELGNTRTVSQWCFKNNNTTLALILVLIPIYFICCPDWNLTLKLKNFITVLQSSLPVERVLSERKRKTPEGITRLPKICPARSKCPIRCNAFYLIPLVFFFPSE